MKIMEKALGSLSEEKDEATSSLRQILGPLFLLCTLSLSPGDSWVLASAVVGLFLVARWQMRGFAYSLVVLSVVAVAEHAFLAKNQFLQLGIEGSLALSFFITALSFDQDEKEIDALSSQIDALDASIHHLEDDLQKERDSAAAQQLSSQEKFALLQKELDELEDAHSSIKILNEVLRKTGAEQIEERQKAEDQLLHAKSQVNVLYSEIADLQRELNRIGNESALAAENLQLSQELNSARVTLEQTRLINETLARLHAKESLSVQELEKQRIDLVEQKKDLQLHLERSRQESAAFSGYLEQASAVRDKLEQVEHRLSEVQTERNFLKERLEKAEIELTIRKEAIPKEELARFEEKIASLGKFEVLYKQLRKQFEEKNKVLHETRSELFRADTELQTLRREKELKGPAVDPLFENAIREVEELNEEISYLENENEELEQLISHLLSSNPNTPFILPPSRKKKVKMNPDQDLLF